MNLTKSIEVATVLRDEKKAIGFGKIAAYSARTPDQIAALTRTIARLEAIDAAQVDEKVWRGNWGNNPVFTETDDIDGNTNVCLMTAATHDALTARCAALERQVTTMREALDTIESMGTIESIEIQEVARRALAREGGEGDAR